MEFEKPSPFSTNRVYRRYQQYYNGVKVQGGGYVGGFRIPDDPTNPCDEAAFLIVPSINSGINVNTSPSILKTSLDNILNSENDIEAELVITLNINENCQYHLTWKTEYLNGGNKTSWVDAHTGIVLLTVENEAHLNAPTETYGTQFLDDSSSGGITSLISSDGKIKTYDFFNSTCPVSTSSFVTNLIPTTTNTQWTTGIAHRTVYQAHHVTESVVPHMEDIGIIFSEIHVGACDEFDAGSTASPVGTAFVHFGRANINSAPLALYEIAAHELTHSYLREFFPTNGIRNNTIHEAICDMVGVYAESKVQGGLNWVMGDDNFDIMNLTDRDLQNPNFDCVDDVMSMTNNPQQRSLPLGHWFYLISTGSPNPVIPALGIDKSIQIALGAAMILAGQDPVDFIEFRDATLAFVDAEFGPCSTEGNAVRAAFNEICLNTSSCGFYVVGPNVVCEEDDQLQLCVFGGLPGAQFLWNFPIDWTATGSTTQSGYTGPCLSIVDFPKYNWYPQYFSIKVSMLNTGVSRYHTIKLIDCLGDDPTCEEYHAFNGDGIGDRNSFFENKQLVNDESTLKIYNLSGQLVYSGSFQQFDIRQLHGTGIYIAAYFDKNGGLIKSKKIGF